MTIPLKKTRKPAPPGQGRPQTPEAYAAMVVGRINGGITRSHDRDPNAPPIAPKNALDVYESIDRIKHAEARIKEAAATEAERVAAERAGRVRSTELFDRWSDDLVAAIRAEVNGLAALVDMQGLSEEAQAGAQRAVAEGRRRLLQRIAALPEWDAIE